MTVWKFGGFDLNVQLGSEEEQLVDGIKNQIQRDEQFEEGLKCSLADKEVYEQKYDKTRQVA